MPQITLDQSLNEEDGKTEEEIQKEIEAKDMAAQAQILEMVCFRFQFLRIGLQVPILCQLNYCFVKSRNVSMSYKLVGRKSKRRTKQCFMNLVKEFYLFR